MKKSLLALVTACLFFSSCGDDNSPDGGEIFFELNFSKDVDDPDALVSILVFSFEGGLAEIDEGTSYKSPPFYVTKNSNVPFAINAMNYFSCLPTNVKAFYRGKEIFSQDYNIGLYCEPRANIITGNVIIPG